MGFLSNITLVFVAGLATALATGLGAIPFFFVEEFSDRWNVGLWGIASGIMVAASLFGLISEGLQYTDEGLPMLMLAGLLAGVVLVEGSERVLDRIDLTSDQDDDDTRLEAEAFADGDLKTLVLVLGILTVHSFPEGVAVGVSFAELGIGGGMDVFGVAIPLLAVFMTLAISIHNIPEGTAIAIPMREMGLSKWRMVGAAVFSSLPQPIGAVIAFAFVSWAQAFLPFGFGFAAGAMIYLVLTEFIPEALETGVDLPHGGYRELAGGALVGGVVMVPLLYV
ncbi:MULTISPECIES: ZIP family metal transporter [Natrinema]|uniref:Divalent heavy-metal cations transporter n=2 Tax=Natrinema TaxID=88723 RepID=L0JUN5_NATP1|nr:MULTISPECIES: ZIP family metal transporter [Natrinema]AGB34106.1 putative divalent heavy-metal cations transporter [Natrinema pellirubrum DSM 15624]ELY72182.1 divalent heavy-metal cations transporter [Natrinema pellirubrum DSM 15624]ELY81877.1 divalent heavy-metal cations transporter [Natrinema pallidum DSM 3751]